MSRRLCPHPGLFHLSAPPRPISPSFFARHFAAAPRPPVRSRLIWLAPVAVGGLALYLAPTPQSLFPAIFASPTLIPCPSSSSSNVHPTIFSPSESDRSISARIYAFIQDRIWEPLLTAKRFAYLFVLFVPVIIFSPIILFGKRRKKYRGDRWGAVWWYGFLVSRMEGAGPTFIKVRFPSSILLFF